MYRALSTILLVLALIATPAVALDSAESIQVDSGAPACPASVDASPVTPSEEEGADLEVEKVEMGICGAWQYAGCCTNNLTKYTRTCQVGPDRWTESKCQGNCFQ